MMFVYLPICGQTRHNLVKNKYQILTYHVNNRYAKLAPDTLQNKQIKETMSYTGDTEHPLYYYVLSFELLTDIFTHLSVSCVP